MRPKKRWSLAPQNKDLQHQLAKELNILPVTAQLLINRGILDSDSANAFLSPDLKNLHNPFLMKGMDKAVERIISAIKDGDSIAIYGDYDVDGVASTALLCLFFKELGVDALYHIPERKKEGYGMNMEAMKTLKEKGVRLVITADCGISNHEEIIFASRLGMDVIVTDHHELSKGAPAAYSVLNPLQDGCLFPFKGLCGAGVAFNLVMALRMRLKEINWFNGNTPNLKKYLDLVGMATISDMVPLVDENRIFASWGLKELNSTKRFGLQELFSAARIKLSNITAETVAFQIAPRLNAAGRLERGDTALKLLMADDVHAAAVLACKINGENSSRQAIEEKILNEALGMLGGSTANSTDRAIVLASEGWHLGVVGIVASRLVERFSKPCVLVAFEGDEGKGSVRGIKGGDVLEGLNAASPFLEAYGGHKNAAGVTVKRAMFGDFKEAYIAFMNKTVTDESLIPQVGLDCALAFDELTPRLTDEIGRLSPFGQSNEKPLFLATPADILSSEVVGQRHLKMTVKQNGIAYGAIGFGMAGLYPLKGRGFDLAFFPYMDEWQGLSSLRLNVKEIRSDA